jgi:hypothetical protein
MKDLESDDFYADVAIASTPASFYRRLRAHTVVGRLLAIIQVAPDIGPQLLNYAASVIGSAEAKVRPENDVALCACVYVLSTTAIAGTDDLLRKLRNAKKLSLKWASYVAELASAEGARTTRAVYMTGDFTRGSPPTFSVPIEISQTKAPDQRLFLVRVA